MNDPLREAIEEILEPLKILDVMPGYGIVIKERFERLLDRATVEARIDELRKLAMTAGVNVEVNDYIVNRLDALKAATPGKEGVSKVTRFEVIDHSKDSKGRCYSKWNCAVELSYQDDGRTLKVFVTDAPGKEDGEYE